MKSSKTISTIFAAVFALNCVLAFASNNIRHVSAADTIANTITVQVNRPGAAISPTQFGLFFEDINFAADGGIYPERVKNRSFEFPDPMMGWKQINREGATGAIYIINQEPANETNGRFLRIATETSGKGFGVMNEGFRGMGVKENADYTFSVLARRAAADTTASALRVELEDEGGHTLGNANVTGITPEWKEYKTTIHATATSGKAHLNVTAEGAVDVDLISLYPQETWKNRTNGLRSDLVQLLRDMKPGFLRFPGGCIVEGRTLEQRYQWKRTIGKTAERKLIVNRWNTEFRHRLTPDYYQSFGLGFYEYFLLSEDIGAEPLPIINCGMACQFNSGELASLNNIDHYIQDALDLIAFANDPVTTVWGKQRAQLGHPAPFHLKMLGVGNEQWGPQYIERYKAFAKVLKARHPEIKLISSAGPSPNDERFTYLWGQMRALKADIVDEHYYMEPKWFRDNVSRYDNYPRTGPKVFAGEFAAQSVGIASPDNRNNWECALSEAAFMTGLERNADLVVMASYAPLFAHVDAWQWTPNMIWFDNLRSYGTPNYYVQKLFSANKGTTILPVLLNETKVNGQNDLFVSATFDAKAGEVVLKVVNTSTSPKQVTINLDGAGNIKGKGVAQVLTAPELKAENSLDEPTKVAPVEQSFTVSANTFTHTFAPDSLTVLRIGAASR